MDMRSLFDKRRSCPSEHALDLFALGELSKKERRAVAAHFKGCSVCAEKARVASMGFQAFPSFDADRVVDRLHRMTAGMESPRWVETALGAGPSVSGVFRPGRFAKVKLAGAAMAACAAALLAWSIYKAPLNPEEGSEVVRAKGGLKLEVLRNRNGEVSETISGDSFFDGDHLRFRVSLPVDGYVMVIGVEQDKSAYPCYPVDGKAAKLSLSRDMILPDAVRLDDSRGEEWLHLMLCREAFDIGAVKTGMRQGTLLVPSGCMLDSFMMNKEPR